MIALGITIAVVVAGIVATVTTLAVQRGDARVRAERAENAAAVMTQSAEAERKKGKEKDAEIEALTTAKNTAERLLAEAEREALAGAPTRRILDVIAGRVPNADGGGRAPGAGPDAVAGEIVVPAAPRDPAGIIDEDLR